MPLSNAAQFDTWATLMQSMVNVMQQNNSTTKDYYVMPDLSKSFGVFDGERGAQEAKLWLIHVESTARLHKWPSTFLLETTTGQLRGAAKS